MTSLRPLRPSLNNHFTLIPTTSLPGEKIYGRSRRCSNSTLRPSQAIDHNGKSRQELEISNPDGVSIENEVTSDRGSNE